MERLKRWVPVIALALVLVLGAGQPLHVFAASQFVSFEDFPSSSYTSGGYDYDVYTVDQYYSWKYVDGKSIYFRQSELTYTTTSTGSFNFTCFYTPYLFNGSSDITYFDLSSYSIPDKLTDLRFSSSLKISCSASVSGNVNFRVQPDGSFLQNFYSVPFSVDSGGVVEILLEDTILDLWGTNYNSSLAGVAIGIQVACRSAPSGATFSVEFEPLVCTLVSVESNAATPVLTSNFSSTPVYYVSGDSAKDLVVFHSLENGEVGDVSVQWYKSSTGSTSDGVIIPGANTYMYKPSISSLGTWFYYCVVTNTYDGKVASATSPIACIKVVEAPKAPQITQNLSSGTMEYTQGDTASPFVISAINSGDGTLSYQWYKNTTNSTSGGTLISGATNSSYTPSTATVGTQYYYCVVTNSVGTLSESTVSNVGAIRVVPPPDPAQSPVINPNLSTSVKEYYIGNPAAELKIGASVTDGGTLTYQWYSNTVNSSSGGTLLPGETDRTFTPPTDTLGTMYYYCVVTNTLPDSSASTTSNVACIRVKELPKASAPVISTNLPSDPIVYTEGDAAAAVGISARSPDGGVLTYQWYKNTVAENTGGTAIAGADKSSYEPDTSEVGTAYYYVVITNSLNDTTASVTSSVATVIVEQDKVPDLIGDVIEGITNLPQAIMDGIVGLFVPNADAIAAYQDQWTELLSSRFGAVYESVMLLDEFGRAVQMQDEQNTVPFPSVTLDFAGVPFTFGGWTVQVVPPGFEFVVEMLKRIISIVATLAFLNTMRNKFERILGGG